MSSPLHLEAGDEEREIHLTGDVATFGDRKVAYRKIRTEGGELVAVEVAGDVFPVRVARDVNRFFVWCAGRTHEIRLRKAQGTRTRSSSAADHGPGLLAPMPGRIRRISVPRGGAVKKGDVVLVLEAMKMEHAIRAPHDGFVAHLPHGEGDLVDAGAVLAEISESPPAGGEG